MSYFHRDLDYWKFKRIARGMNENKIAMFTKYRRTEKIKHVLKFLPRQMLCVGSILAGLTVAPIIYDGSIIQLLSQHLAIGIGQALALLIGIGLGLIYLGYLFFKPTPRLIYKEIAYIYRQLTDADSISEYNRLLETARKNDITVVEPINREVYGIDLLLLRATFLRSSLNFKHFYS